ncbi:IS3 family transposase [Vibrio vulnificus]
MTKFTFSIRSWGADAFEMSWLKKGHNVNRKRVVRLMRDMGIGAIYPKPRTTLANKAHKVYPYLLRDIEVTYPNQAWAIDITYIPMAKGFLYLVATIDWYSRKVLSWRLSNTMDTSFCIEALEDALKHYGPPDIFNSDQGSQFTSTEFTQKLIDHGVRISMDGKGRWVDNVFIERLWRSLKYEEVYLNHKRSLSETAMHRVKQLLGGRLSLGNYNAQVGETYAMIKALNKLTGLGMPETMVIA